jgi:hypothetical protein
MKTNAFDRACQESRVNGPPKSSTSIAPPDGSGAGYAPAGPNGQAEDGTASAGPGAGANGQAGAAAASAGTDGATGPSPVLIPSLWSYAEKQEWTLEQVCTTATAALRVVYWLLDSGFWPCIIAAAGAEILTRFGPLPSDGKTPCGKAWGSIRLTPEAAFAWSNRCLRLAPGHGAGLCLGPGRGPGGRWLIDGDLDGPRGEESLQTLCGGCISPTLGWSSTRGRHFLFLVDGLRLLALLARSGAEQGQGRCRGVWHVRDLPDLELRIGGYNNDGMIMQFQSVCPPSIGSDGQRRQWNDCWEIAWLPENAYQFLADQKQTALCGKSALAPSPEKKTIVPANKTPVFHHQAEGFPASAAGAPVPRTRRPRSRRG